MSEPINDGGPAFPFSCQGLTTGPEIYYGMTLRDYFAGRAMNGELAAESERFHYTDSETATREEVIAERSFKLADAMLKERAK